MPEWWYINNDGEKIHPTTAFSENFNMESLFRLSGVEHFRVNVDDLENDDKFIELRKKRGYDYEDLVELSPEALPNLIDKLQEFFTEHLHEDEEIRLFLEGSAYFDVRNSYDEWCRIRAEKGDLLILPAGIYHRFTLDDKNCCKVKRYFCGNPVWKALNRPTDCPARQEYLKRVAEMRRQDSRLTG